METGSFIGIDFGNENTTIVCVTGEGSSEKITVLGEDGETPFAALVAITNDNKLFFGHRVKKSFTALSENSKLVTRLAELLGSSKSISVNGKECPPKQLAAEYFRAIKRVVTKKFGIEITEAAFTCPSSFSYEAKQDLLAAAQKADIKITAFLPECFSTYLAARERISDKRFILSADWGGSSMDINILENDGGRIRPKTSLSKKMGGRDIDRVLAEKLHEMLGSILADKSKIVPFDNMPAAERDKMMAAAENAKIEISEKGGEVAVTLENYGVYGTNTLHLTEELFADIIKPIVREHIIGTINSAMEHAKLRAADIGAVIASGGSCGLKAFSGVLKSIFGEEKLVLPKKPQIVTAKGAAIAPVNKGVFKLSEDIGVLMSDDTVFPLLRKDFPAAGLKSGSYTFGTVDGSDTANIVIADGKGTVFSGLNVPVKEFPESSVGVEAEIDTMLSASVKLHGSTETGCKIDSVNCYYDLSENI